MGWKCTLKAISIKFKPRTTLNPTILREYIFLESKQYLSEIKSMLSIFNCND